MFVLIIDWGIVILWDILEIVVIGILVVIWFMIGNLIVVMVIDCVVGGMLLGWLLLIIIGLNFLVIMLLGSLIILSVWVWCVRWWIKLCFLSVVIRWWMFDFDCRFSVFFILLNDGGMLFFWMCLWMNFKRLSCFFVSIGNFYFG